MNQNLVNEITDLIVQSVNLQHMDRSQIHSDTPLTQGGLGLDSVDILEIVVAIEHQYGVKVADAETGAKYFRTIGTISEFVQTHSTKP
jgi:acyl carrier protein